MFIRKTIKKDSKNGKSYSSYYLVESIRTDKGPRQKVLLYMGSEIKLPEVFAGLAPGLTGLYLVSVRLPDTLANGDYSLSCAQTPVGGAKLIVAHGYQ